MEFRSRAGLEGVISRSFFGIRFGFQGTASVRSIYLITSVFRRPKAHSLFIIAYRIGAKLFEKFMSVFGSVNSHGEVCEATGIIAYT